MAIMGDALRQAFMPKHEYESLREEDKAWGRLQRPVLMVMAIILWLCVVDSSVISLNIVFQANGERPFCHDRRFHELPVMPKNGIHVFDLFPGDIFF
ncbi:hypothetical protein AMTR_s00146p00054490 [Amborella trichopoda]|uniref:Uncharacterized protein n=1 Tax=Amborella trichopoda TaxID=13333 RepID=W1P4P2_AMBTC|nr:hypothetical protein AMTR_s00146p00054490 [Amborella trichopoda]